MEPDNEPADEPLDALARAYDEALAAGLAPPETTPASLAPELLPQWHRLQQCLVRLEQDRLRKEGETPIEQLNATPLPAYSAFESPSNATRRVGRFEIIRELGRGGFGIVFLAHDPRLRRDVALKVPRPEALVTEELRRRFRREAEAAARLGHPNLIAIHEVGEVGPIHYLVTDYCPGPILAAWLKQETAPLSPGESARLLAALADAVAYMHSQGVLHRDIKPSNILLQKKSKIQNPKSENEGEEANSDLRFRISDLDPRLTDFGLAKFTGEATHRTQTGAMLGTPAYMAPEQADGRLAEVTVRSDVYALGVVLYELLTGRPPFQGANDVETVQQVLTQEPLPPRRLRPGVRRDLETICLKCLEKEPKRRYAGAAQLLEDLRSFQAGEPIRARPAGVLERAAKWARRRPAVAALSGVATAALLVLAAWAIWYDVKLREHTAALKIALDHAEAGERKLREEKYAIQMKLADTMQGNDPSGSLGELLNSFRPGPEQEDLRGFEWYHLWNVARREQHLRGHNESVSAVAISSDGNVGASGDGEGNLRLWDMRTGLPLGAWAGHKFGVTLMAFSRDGSQLTTAAQTRGRTEFALWDVVSKQPLARIENKKPARYGRAIGPGGDLIAFDEEEGDDEHRAFGIWNAHTGQVKYILRGLPLGIAAAAFSPDGRTQAFATVPDCIVHCWELSSGKERLLPLAHYINLLSFSPDGKFLASVEDYGSIKFWDPAKWQLHATRDLKERVDKVAFSPDGKVLALDLSAQKDRPETEALILWNWPGCDRRPEVLEPGYYISAIGFSPDSQTIAVGGFDYHVRLWRPLAASAVSTLAPRGKAEAWSVAFSPDSRTLAVGYDDQTGPNQETLQLWDVATRRERANLRSHSAMVSSVAYAADGLTLCSAGYDNRIKRWDARSHEVLANFKGHTKPIKYVACSPDGQTLATVSFDKLVKVWDIATGQERFSLKGHTGGTLAVAFAPNGKEFASACLGGRLFIWDVATGQKIREIKDSTQLFSLAYAPSGLLIASGNRDGVVKLHDLTGESEPRSLLGHKSEARAVAFSPDGRTLASGGDDRTVRLWHVATGRELLVFKDLPHKVNSVAFSSDGRHLAAAIHDGSVRLWHAAHDE
jgi:tRNA A-37 threonylcarbamoyl transferase component Bud32